MAWLATRLYSEFKAQDEASGLIIEGLALEMIGEAGRHAAQKHGGKVPPWLKQARELLHSNFSESMSLAGIAESVGVHPVYLAGEFRRRFGLTVGEYVRRLQIEYACLKLSGAAAHLPLVYSRALLSPGSAKGRGLPPVSPNTKTLMEVQKYFPT